MPALWLPPEVSRELRDHTASYRAEVLKMIETAGPVQAAWNPTLQAKDPRLSMIRAKESANAVGLIPGYYHLMMDGEGVPLTFLAIRNPDGSFTEPSHRTLTWLSEADLQNPQVIRERDAQMRSLEERTAKDRAAIADEVTEEAEERWAAATRTQVSMNPDTPWSQNASGARAAKAYKRDKRRTEE